MKKAYFQLYQFCLAGALLAAVCTAASAQAEVIQGTGLSSLRVRPCSLSIQVTKNNLNIVSTQVAGHPKWIVEIRNDDHAGLRQHIQKSCDTEQAPSVSIHVDADAPFQSLVNVIAEMVPARAASFEISADTRRIMMRIPLGRPQIGQTEINLMVTAQGAYGLNDRNTFEHLNLRDLSGTLRALKSGKQCCFVIVHADAKASVPAFMDAIAAIQLAAIDDYWILSRGPGSAKNTGELKTLKQRILNLEKEQERLRQEAVKKAANLAK